MQVNGYRPYLQHGKGLNIMIDRVLTTQIHTSLKRGKVIALFGARRTGKTIIMKSIIKMMHQKKTLEINGEDFDIAAILSSGKQEVLKNLVSGYDYLFVDEAQNIPRIGHNLKLLVDTQPDVGVFVTGSSSFDLRNQIGEPLTGRSRFFQLYPLSLSEISPGYANSMKLLPELLVFGSYPQIITETNLTEKRHILENIRNGYLLKDVLILENIKDSLFIIDLLRLLAFQIGNDISYNELANNLGTTVKTIKRYIEILEKTFVIFRMYGYSKNLRKEISKSPRFYFWDNGIRNIVISNFQPIEIRNDKGMLWENFCISERIKKQMYSETFSNFHFWRTYDQQEIDLIEVTDGKLKAFGFKWGEKEAKAPKAFRVNYPDAIFQTINRISFFEFLKM